MSLIFKNRRKIENARKYLLQLILPCVIIFAVWSMVDKEVTGMKEKIHPQYKDTTITCACGNVIHTRSTKENIRVEICSKCHPFFTGKQKLVDTSGRVDMFKKRYGIGK